MFTGWSGDASGSNLTSSLVLTDSPKRVVAEWKKRCYVVAETPTATS
ncbi:hypothetical protein IG193_06225 [Infirmifilum lucidum]|uniref:Uncharacterized protein n=1 Tax=Infirmifilum lucidum TaxID=2776706 RepID=A0A7L9FGA3_9CREN|nr:hypothetical protein [Infirmifilum lucidum]QOJ78352.1 hypothetical protein IG193_06225 [Infirmifilum lucidum]